MHTAFAGTGLCISLLLPMSHSPDAPKGKPAAGRNRTEAGSPWEGHLRTRISHSVSAGIHLTLGRLPLREVGDHPLCMTDVGSRWI